VDQRVKGFPLPLVVCSGFESGEKPELMANCPVEDKMVETCSDTNAVKDV
jgi:hypothetical protein